MSIRKNGITYKRELVELSNPAPKSTTNTLSSPESFEICSTDASTIISENSLENLIALVTCAEGLNKNKSPQIVTYKYDQGLPNSVKIGSNTLFGLVCDFPRELQGLGFQLSSENGFCSIPQGFQRENVAHRLLSSQRAVVKKRMSAPLA